MAWIVSPRVVHGSCLAGVNAGHYTCYVRNPLSNKWQYCNDENVSQQEPSEADAASVYILFYQRRGEPD